MVYIVNLNSYQKANIIVLVYNHIAGTSRFEFESQLLLAVLCINWNYSVPFYANRLGEMINIWSQIHSNHIAYFFHWPIPLLCANS